MLWFIAGFASAIGAVWLYIRVLPWRGGYVRDGGE